jgi:very-short-patch-repair endonuclease
MTPAEGLLWQRLRHRKLGAKFRRQVPIGPFIVDFYCHEARLVVEVDGEAHADESQAALDAARTEWLEDEGYRVLRVRNDELIGEIDSVTARIQRELPLSRSAEDYGYLKAEGNSESHPSPAPRRLQSLERSGRERGGGEGYREAHPR